MESFLRIRKLGPVSPCLPRTADPPIQIALTLFARSGGTSTSADGTHNRVQSDGSFTYTYDSEGNLIQRVGQVPTQVDIGVLNGGVAIDDAAIGTGYLMYSRENVFDRFAANPPAWGKTWS